MTHEMTMRVYYEDTDLAGIVYYANYLKYIERARSEYVRGLGIDQVRLKAEKGIVFAVRRVVADYFAPACFDDMVKVQTHLKSVSGARIDLHQSVLRGDTVLFEALVTLVCLGDRGRAVRWPADIRSQLK